MISKKLFVDTIVAIREQHESSYKAESELQKIGLTVSHDQMPYLQTLLDLFKATVPDPYDYINWWLFEAADHNVTWQKDGKEMTADLTEPGALYDFLTGDARPLPEKLPFIDLPEYPGNTEYRTLGIEQVDFCNYMDAVLEYVEQNEVVICIMMEGVKQYALMSAKLYSNRFSELSTSHNEDNLVTVCVEIDADLANAARKVLAKEGLTLEQALELFLRWCAYHPEEATAWIKKAMADQGIKPNMDKEAEK